jgi:tRNA A-37 threonylcarbamoyl transferase component Bud32
MTDAKQCPGCRYPLPADAPQGLCPNCLLQQAFFADPPPANTAAYRAPAVPPSPEELAEAFPQLEVIELLGQGGMGAVYKVRQKRLDRLVALKIVPPELARDSAFAERFAREARALARLSHPNIVAVYDFGEVKGLYYFLMEYVDGVNLRQMIQGGHVKPQEALRIVPQVCAALQYAHDQGIVHRDIKPENILVDRRGQVKIADFGLAKLLGQSMPAPALTGSQQVMGTPHYMAPEQVEHPLDVDHRADIYSLGVVFYEMLTGELPLGRFPPPSQKAGVDVRLDQVVLRTLERDPGRRYQNVSELRTAVEDLFQVKLPEEIEQVAQALNISSRELIALAGIALCMVLLGVGLWATKQTFLLFGLPFVGKVASQVRFRSTATLFAALLLAAGGLGLTVLALMWTPGGWWMLIPVWLWFGDYVHDFLKDTNKRSSIEAEGPREYDGTAPAGLTQDEIEVWNVLKRFESDAGLYLVPDLPAEGLHNARGENSVPPSERILALLDFTGDGDDCTYSLLFGCRGIYTWGKVGDTHAAIGIPYAEFPLRTFVNHGLLVYLGKDQFLEPDLDESPTDCETITRLLNALRAVVEERNHPKPPTPVGTP